MFLYRKLKPLLQIIIVFMYLNMVNAQKTVKKTIVSPDISYIQIDASNCFELNLQTTDTNELEVEAMIDGEYKNDLLLQVRIEGATVLVSSGFQPNYKNPNDKLSTHKVISIALKIKLPKQKNVTVFGTGCNIKATGLYKNLKVTLNDGRCDLINVSETVEISTQSGDISVKSLKATIHSESKYGLVLGDKLPIGHDHYILRTVSGNIHLNSID